MGLWRWSQAGILIIICTSTAFKVRQEGVQESTSSFLKHGLPGFVWDQKLQKQTRIVCVCGFC